MINIVIADDHQAVRRGLKNLLSNEADFQVIGEAGNGLETVEMVDDLNPDILILDLMMPGINGLEVARRLSRNGTQTKMIILSMHSNEAYVTEALHSGAQAYILKDSLIDDLVPAIREVLAGRCFLSLLLYSASKRNLQQI